MMKKSFLFISMIVVLLIAGCIKETYNMSMLSKKARLSPVLAISAIKGDIALSDMVKTNDTIVFGQDKLVTIVFKKDSVVDLKLTDFSKGTLVQKIATIDPYTFNLDIDEILSHITGDFMILDPTITFNYKNSFPDSIKINLNATGKRKNKTADLGLAPFILARPNIPVQPEIAAFFKIDKTNSNLPNLISLPPEEISFSGSAIMSKTVKGSQVNNVLGPNRLLGSLEIRIPMDLKINNLQFTDTVDNFLKTESNNSDNSVQPEDFQFLRVKIIAKNGFPLGVSLTMSLFDSSTNTTKSTVNADRILDPAPVDGNGRSTGVTETSTIIEFTREFFSSVNNADRIIFRFTLNSTGSGSQEVKIYSDYRIDFQAALVVKPEINLK